MIPSAIKGLLGSEKAFAGGTLVIAATVFVFLGRMTVAEWQDFCTWVFGIYAVGKTVTGTVSVLKNGNEEVAPQLAVGPIKSSEDK